MNLRNRSLLILGLIFFAIFIIVAAVSLSVTLSGLDRIEYQDVGEAVNQTRSALNEESQSLLSTTQDWGWWDDMAAFAVNHNTDFINRNADPEGLATIRVHLFVILDPEGNILYDRLMSPDFRQNASVPEDIIRIIRNNPRLIYHAADDTGTNGILLLPEGPMVVASTPILLSDRSGPVRGTILMGRYIEYGPLQRINSFTSYDVALHWQDKVGGDTEQFSALERQLEGKNLLLVPDNESTITGYSPVRDLVGRDMVIGVTMQRGIYRIGLAMIYTYLVLLALWVVMTGLIVVIVMDRTVLHRMELLTSRVRALPDNHEDSPAPVLGGNDELAVLEQSILASRAGLLMSERQLRVFINAMPDPAALYSRDGKLLLANPAFAAYVNKRPEDLTGTMIRDILPSSKIQEYHRDVEEVIRTKAMVQHEDETGEKTLLVSHYPVLDGAGNVVQIGLLTFDISERKRLENALRNVMKKISLLNTVIFNDIQNKIFVQRGYQELLRTMVVDPKVREFLEKEEAAIKEIQSSLEFARQYSDMGIHPPRWQDVNEVMVFAVSHLDLGSLRRDFNLEGLEIYADSLLERVFFNLAENVIRHAKTATVIRAGYQITENGAMIFIEDDGVGIPAGSKERIFEKGAGTEGAVGLFLSREILSITGITIRETSGPGKGARFEMMVPKGSYRLTGT
jgi:PAS domain S-box-containing protein